MVELPRNVMNKKMSTQRPTARGSFHKMAYYLMMALLFLLPFHAFGTVALNYGYGFADVFGSAMYVSMWKEFLLAILVILLGIQFVIKRELPKLDMLDWLILGYIGFGIVHALLIGISIEQFIWGARFDYMFLVIFLVVRHVHFDEFEVKGLLETTLWAGFFSLLTGCIIHYWIKPENLIIFGFRNDWSTWYPGQSLAFCQKIENQELCRMSGTFAGPNQLGAYAVMLIPVLLYWRDVLFYKMKGWIPIITLCMAFFALYATYSRGAILGLMVVILTFALYRSGIGKRIQWRYVVYGLVIFCIVVAGALLVLSDQLIRPESTGEHLAAWIMGVKEMISHPLGQGLGAAGPASYRVGTPIIPESWYLQVGIELGPPGLALFFAILIVTIKKLWEKISQDPKAMYALPSFLGVLTIAFFLHTFEDSAVSLTLFSILGLVLTDNQ